MPRRPCRRSTHALPRWVHLCTMARPVPFCLGQYSIRFVQEFGRRNYFKEKWIKNSDKSSKTLGRNVVIGKNRLECWRKKQTNL